MSNNDETVVVGEDYVRHATFHCKQCNSVLADSYGISGEVQTLDAIKFAKVSSKVVHNSNWERPVAGSLIDCICSSLKCGGCSSDVGRVIQSTPVHLDHLRSGFLLFKSHMNCYVLGSSMVELVNVQITTDSLKESLSQMRRDIETQEGKVRRIREDFTKLGIVSCKLATPKPAAGKNMTPKSTGRQFATPKSASGKLATPKSTARRFTTPKSTARRFATPKSAAGKSATPKSPGPQYASPSSAPGICERCSPVKFRLPARKKLALH